MRSGDAATVGVILAGGAGRRIGGRKAFVALAGRPLLAHVVDRLAPQVTRLAVNAAPDPGFAAFGLPVLPDPRPDCGPLGGILAALDWAEGLGESRVITAAVDTPFLPTDLVRRLAASTAPAAYASTPEGPHPTTAIWTVGLRSELGRALESGVRKVRDWAAAIEAEAIAFDAPEAFMNVNTSADLRRAERRLAE